MPLEEFKNKFRVKDFNRSWLKDLEFLIYSHQYFCEWFDKNHFDYYSFSFVLPKEFPEFFNIWWNPEKLNFLDDDLIDNLGYFLPTKFTIWWDIIYFYFNKFAIKKLIFTNF